MMRDDVLSILLGILLVVLVLFFGRLLSLAFREGRLLGALLAGAVFFVLCFFLALFVQLAIEAM